jgi:DNA-binding CsgD family transcriptional regulator
VLHATIAQALEQHYGAAAADRADELAYHFVRAHSSALISKALKYLSSAGRAALAKYSNREAASYLDAAVRCIEEGSGAADAATTADLVFDLARARQRLGEYDAAMALWERAREQALRASDPKRLGTIERRMGLACFWSGRVEEAIRHYEAGLVAADMTDDLQLRVRLRVAKGMALQQLGRPDEAREHLREALVLAEMAGPELVARVHRALLLLDAWTGPPDRAREHGRRAIELAERSDDRTLAFSAHWAMAVLEALNGNPPAFERHVAQSSRIADELRSPVLRAWSAELEIESASVTGRWESGVALGEQTIAIARALNQQILLPRVLVWTGLMYLGRDEVARGKQYIDEAWDLSGAARAADGMPNVDTVVPAHIGRASYHLAVGEYEEAIRVGEAGLDIADRSGYVVWRIWRMLAVIAEACIRVGDLNRAEQLGQRLRRESERLGHRLGLAWADACDALVAWLRGDVQTGSALMGAAVTRLDAVPFVIDAARLRRQFAGRLLDVGDRDAALHELRVVHDVFSRLGAVRELNKTRDMFREAGARPPVRSAGPGVGALTGRELEIARLAAARKSNKAIARELDISARTVSTHLSNIFRKLEVTSRAEVADAIRRSQ